MTFKMPRNLMAAVSVVAFAALLSSCGGGGGSSPVATMDDDTTTMDDDTTMAGPMIAGKTVPSGTTVTLPEGTDAPNVTFRAAMGDTVPVAGIGVFTCASADGCTVDVTDDVVTTTGDIVVVALAIEDPALLASVLTQLANAITPPVAPEPTELETAQADAATAAATAKMASDDAAIAAKAATEAVANLATGQTGAASAALAKEAADYADKAKKAYAAAKKASDDAEVAEDVTTAVKALLLAELAMADAVSYEKTASEKGTAAETAANAELMIVGTVKTVGGTSLDATAAASTKTDGEGETAQVTRTGLIKGLNPMTEGPGVPADVDLANGAKVFVQAMPEAETPVEGVAHKQAVEARTLAIGKVVDSSNDMARLMIVTQYAGTKSVKVYADGLPADDLVDARLLSDGRLQTAGTPGTPSADDTFVTLKSIGTYYLAGTDDTGLSATDVVLKGTEGKEVFSFSGTGRADRDDDDVSGYVVLGPKTTDEAVTTVTYWSVDIEVPGPTVDAVDTMMQVTANIPEATPYKHIHFGVWAALGKAAANGSQKLSDLGIGFVQNFSGGGLTSIGGGIDDLPNTGTATYNGNWVAAVQAADGDGNGAISLTNGKASMSANFGMGKIIATLTNLATLEGAIADNTFSGKKATVAANENGLTAKAAFTGSFNGGFYGAAAAEAGGVFAFTSKELKAGAFRGAFGGDKN